MRLNIYSCEKKSKQVNKFMLEIIILSWVFQLRYINSLKNNFNLNYRPNETFCHSKYHLHHKNNFSNFTLEDHAVSMNKDKWTL